MWYTSNEEILFADEISKNPYFRNRCGNTLCFRLRHQMSVLIFRLASLHCMKFLHNLERPNTDNEAIPRRQPSVIKLELDETPNQLETAGEQKQVTANESSGALNKFPKLHSFLITDSKHTKQITKSLLSFISSRMNEFSKFFHLISPMNNQWRMNYQSQQAIRVFFGKNTDNRTQEENAVRRHAYGPLAVLKSTGSHPSEDYKIRPFCQKLDQVSQDLAAVVKKMGVNVAEFNFLEVKMYLGDDMFLDERGSTIKNSKREPLRLGCNKQLNTHNDLNFADDGSHAASDTACPKQPTVTVTIGSCRRLYFEYLLKKNGERRWGMVGDRFRTDFLLGHGSIFVLSPEDDKPARLKRTKGDLYKTKHGATFDGEGVSFAFVFRRVLKTSMFHAVTHNWLWHYELQDTRETVEKHLRNMSARGFDKDYKRQHAEEIAAIESNIRKYTNTLG